MLSVLALLSTVQAVMHEHPAHGAIRAWHGLYIRDAGAVGLVRSGVVLYEVAYRCDVKRVGHVRCARVSARSSSATSTLHLSANCGDYALRICEVQRLGTCVTLCYRLPRLAFDPGQAPVASWNRFAQYPRARGPRNLLTRL